MCGRFNLRLSPAALQEFFDLFHVPLFLPRYNIGPLCPSFRERRRLSSLSSDTHPPF